eukprot:4855088-Amphidinium_carterae.1
MRAVIQGFVMAVETPRIVRTMLVSVITYVNSDWAGDTVKQWRGAAPQACCCYEAKRPLCHSPKVQAMLEHYALQERVAAKNVC